DNKDQTYFLATVDRQRFADVLFPIGDLSKPQVRELARRAGLPNHARHDSTGICFIGERQLQPFLEHYLEPKPGPIVAIDGHTVGQHRGLTAYTLGQRRGLAVGGQPNASDAPWYVVAKDATRNALIVSQDRDDPRLMSSRLRTAVFHWINQPQPMPTPVSARIRHRQPLQEATAAVQADGTVEVSFAKPQRAVAVGQYVVLYDGQECLGGGEIAGTDAPRLQ
ncbi:MAG: tRNA 2-thiouridine(34) synthase MnmA, partial [Sinobacteraceae bacterium]|nr:tRNA 2-thiouridine(34) synthase MnmA [Nevskiaceae bacterium]